MELEKTDKTTGKLIEMARELNQWDGSHDWAGTFDAEDADDYRNEFGEGKLNEALSEMDTDEE